jgi:hypothetical protein
VEGVTAFLTHAIAASAAHMSATAAVLLLLLLPLSAAGEFKLSKVRKAPTGSRSRAQSPFFWRYSVDTATCQLLTDRPVTDLVVQ